MVSEATIKRLVKLGGKIKASRMYFSAENLGVSYIIHVDGYEHKKGDIVGARMEKWETLKNVDMVQVNSMNRMSEENAYQLSVSKNYIELETGICHSTSVWKAEVMESRLNYLLIKAQQKGEIKETAESKVEERIVVPVKMHEWYFELYLAMLVEKYEYLLEKATGFKDMKMQHHVIVFEGMDDENEGQKLLIKHMLACAEANRGHTMRNYDTIRPDNEKKAFRAFLTKIGWKDAETKLLRESLCQGLAGK